VDGEEEGPAAGGEGGHEGGKGADVVQVAVGRDDEARDEAAGVEEVEDALRLVARVDEDARPALAGQARAAVKRKDVGVLADGTYRQALYHGIVNLA